MDLVNVVTGEVLHKGLAYGGFDGCAVEHDGYVYWVRGRWMNPAT